MLRMRRGGRDLRIALGSIKSFLGNGRIVVQMDQVVRDARMLRLPFKDRLEQRGTLKLVGISFIRRRSGNIQCDRVGNLGFIVFRITQCHLFFSFQIVLHARAMIDRVVVGLHCGNSIDIISLALRFCTQGLTFFDSPKTERKVFLRRPRMRIVQVTKRDAPISYRTVRICLEHIVERPLSRAIPERMLIEHAAVEQFLRGRVA